MRRFAAILCLSSTLTAWASAADSAGHAIALSERVLTADDGLLLGNGDLSVSVYESADRIIFRFGKSDVWDRRIDRSDDPRPAHIDEIARGIRDEGWKCPPYGGPVEALRGARDPQRMREICQAVPPSYNQRPYPCPKPVGELALQLPADQMGLTLEQRLSIEEARLSIRCTWSTGAALTLEAFVPPRANVLVLSWRMANWTAATRTGNNVPPVWFSLYRWADPTIAAFAARFFAEYRHDGFRAVALPKATPLPPPTTRTDDGMAYIAQDFPADPTFPNGFQCLVAPLCADAQIAPVDMGPTGEARIHIVPRVDALEGTLAVAVATTSDTGGALETLERTRAAASAARLKAWEEENRAAAREFWSRSRVTIADPLLENLWYETLHARRVAYRAGAMPPGLFLPSTVQDYAHWHGDYHTNYNFQEPFWGDLAANHLELSDAYLDGMKYLFDVGRLIAKKYYGVRGMFVQLSGYPAVMEDDPLGCVPMGRMAYMTGWAVNQLWWRYLYSRDTDWLRATGYPPIRDAALFYTDFLTRGADGLYHAFPSNQGEDGFTGNPRDYTDRAQVMRHARYCLRIAIEASEVLTCDEDLRGAWRDRLMHMAGDEGRPPDTREGIARECEDRNPPELGVGRPFSRVTGGAEGPQWPPDGDGAWTWYFGQYSWMVIQRLRQGDFVPERDFAAFARMVKRWRHPNGILWGMAIANYGHAGAWTESLGVNAALQEMLLQSWDGALRIFPGWPRAVAASFENFRAEGAFLVSASWTDGEVRTLRITSEKGGRCRFYPPWAGAIAITDDEGRTLAPAAEPDNRMGFDTTAGRTYRIERGR
jgi:alpha-L-fucosidase 2